MPLRIPSSTRSAPNLIGLRDIGAGANLKASRFTIPPNQMVLLENFYLIEDGSLMGRRGMSRWNASSLGAGAVLGGTRAYFAAANQFLAAHAGTIYKGDDGTKTFASSLTGWNASSSVWFWQYLNFVYASNKVDAPQKYDGTSWSAMGIAAPGSAPTLAVGAAGTPNGTYTCKVAFKTATIESNAGPASGSVAVVNQQIDISNIPLGPAGTTGRVLYFFKSGVSSTYQKAIEVNDNVTTTATLTTDQPSWTTTALSTNDPPPTGPWITVLFKNRLWKAGDPNNTRRVSFSQIFVPEAWPSGFYVDVPFSFNDEVTALFVLGDLLLIMGHVELYFVVGDTPFSFIVRRNFAPRGCPSPWAVTKVENTALYFSRFAVLAFDGAQARILSDPIEPHFTGVFPNIAAVNYDAADKTTLAYYDRLKAVAVSFPTGASTSNDTTWWYFLRRQGWAKDTRNSRLLITTDGKKDLGDLYAWDVADGIMRQWDPANVYTDDGISITARFKTGVLTGDHPIAEKVFSWLTFRARPASIVVQVTASVDQGAETDNFTLNLLRGAVYGTGLYGTATYAADFDDFEERFEADMKGRGLSLDCAATYAELYHVAQMYVTHFTLPVVRRRV